MLVMAGSAHIPRWRELKHACGLFKIGRVCVAPTFRGGRRLLVYLQFGADVRKNFISCRILAVFGAHGFALLGGPGDVFLEGGFLSNGKRGL